MYILNPDFKILTLKVGKWLQGTSCRVQGAGVQGCRLQVAGCRVQVAGYRLQGCP